MLTHMRDTLLKPRRSEAWKVAPLSSIFDHNPRPLTTNNRLHNHQHLEQQTCEGQHSIHITFY